MRALLFALLAILSWSIVGCTSPPAPPTLTPKQVTVTGFTPSGLVFVVEVEAYNPNAFAINVRNVSGDAKLDGKYDLGGVTVPSTIQIPAKGTTTISTPLTIRFNDVGALGLMAASKRSIPFEVTGKVAIGSEKLNVDVPFHIEGVITHEQIMQGAMRSLPGLPGMPGAPRPVQ